MKSQALKNFDLPDAPGVYYFLAPSTKNLAPRILYIGKATSPCDRVKSYFSKDIFVSRGPRIVRMMREAESVEYVQTDSVLEALILEANEIKKHQPVYNAREKDDKSYNFVVITEEEFPRILIRRGRELTSPSLRPPSPRSRRGAGGEVVFGPFPHSGELKAALKIIRKIFSFRDNKCKLGGRPCFNAQIGLCPGPCAGWITKAEYRKQIKKIKLFFEAKKPQLIKTLEREMSLFAKKHEFEKAEEVKRKIFALDHIQDIALIKADLQAASSNLQAVFRIEAYDIAHLSGTNVVGVMTVVEDGEVNKSQYRKFKIKVDKNDDTKNLKEILNRRLNHPEWPLPNLIVVDGGLGQLNAARAVTDIPIVAVTKDERHKVREILKGPTLSINSQGRTLDKAILLANAEAHRFAIGYHRKLRGKGFRI